MSAPVSDVNLSIGLFTSRESVDEVWTSLVALLNSTPDRVCLDIVVNGAPARAHDFAMRCYQSLCDGQARSDDGEPAVSLLKPYSRIRVWSIIWPDKAQAYNEFIHKIWPRARFTVFVDGYVTVQDDTLAKLAETLHGSPECLAATGVPSGGRGAKVVRERMLRDGGLHGNVFMLTYEAMQGLRDCRFRLPVGMYRVDSTLGAALAFRFDPARYGWNPKARISVVEDATWQTPPKRWWSFRDVVVHAKRVVRQHAGQFEMRALSFKFSRLRQSFGSMPMSVAEFVDAWALHEPKALASMKSWSILHRLAWQQIRATAKPDMNRLGAQIIYDSVGGLQPTTMDQRTDGSEVVVAATAP